MNLDNRIKVLIVQNRSTVRSSVAHILNSDRCLQVVGIAKNGREAIQFLARQQPDIILMDSDMPEMNGLDTTRRIMETQPLPIVVCAGTSPREAEAARRILEAGAVACVEMPPERHHSNFAACSSTLVQTLKLMSEVRVVHRWSREQRSAAGGGDAFPVRPPLATCIDLIGIGASTGGPPVLQTILHALPADFPIPVLIVQHIAKGFLHGLVDWLNGITDLHVKIASHGVMPQPGYAYLAPDDCHMELATDGTIALISDAPVHGLCPSVARLFRSMADVCGPSAVGVLLTGMGKDGAKELKRLRDRGAVTIAQDRQTSVVHGMPGEAIAIGAATNVLSADRIAPTLIALASQRCSSEGVYQ